jgi:hypothetical protein
MLRLLMKTPDEKPAPAPKQIAAPAGGKPPELPAPSPEKDEEDGKESATVRSRPDLRIVVDNRKKKPDDEDEKKG